MDLWNLVGMVGFEKLFHTVDRTIQYDLTNETKVGKWYILLAVNFAQEEE